ncbi:MAG TPA: hypothetical protein VE843_00010 [Ktedonobacteraceae bacterium]|nr:hypothetical protein [Ktedonobacteraceae bacterium]
MTSNTHWISFNDVNKHPEDSVLLAYLRGQKLEARSSVIQHIENEKCTVCLHKLNELKHVSATLDIFGEMRTYQYYPELTVADTYARMQNALNSQISAKNAMSDVYYRRRPRKSAMRLISIPAAIALTLLLTMFVFASFSGRSFNPFSPAGNTKPSQNTLTMAVPPQTTSTPGVNVTATATRTSGAKEPHMKVCSTPADVAHMRLVICGSHFVSKHKITLIVSVPGKQSFSIQSIPVDTMGTFQVGLPLAACSNVPAVLDAYEKAGPKLIKVELQIRSFGSCSLPTATPVVKPSGFSSNFVP